MSTTVEAPPPRNYAQESKDTLQTQIDLADDLLAAEQRTRPEYADLERRMMLEQLGVDPNIGLLEAYEDFIAPSQVRQRRRAVEGDIAMVKDLGQDLIDAQREADPLAESLRQKVLTGSGDLTDRMEGELDGEFIQGLEDEMTGGVVEDLREEYEAGGGLTEQERRDLDQQVLGMASERGAVGQNMTDFSRMRERLTGDRSVRQQRLQNYMGAKQQALGNYMNARQQGLSNYSSAMQNAAASYQLGAQDPLLALTGRASRVPGDVAGQFGTAGFALQSSPGIFNPESPAAQSIYASNQQNIMDARTATASNRANMIGGIFGGLGALGGGIFSGGFSAGGKFNK